MSTVELTVDRADDHLVLHWSLDRRAGSCRFDRLSGTTPEWLGSADELLEGTDRRTERRVVDAVATWAESEGVQLAMWHDDAGIELLG